MVTNSSIAARTRDLFSRFSPAFRASLGDQAMPPTPASIDVPATAEPPAPVEPTDIAALRARLADRSIEVEHPFAVRNIELTNRCPLKCVMCARTYDMDRDQGLMDFETFKKVIDEYVQVNPRAASDTTLDLHHFGDSLMHPQYAKFARYATDRGVFTTDSINPILLKDRLIEQILDGDVLRQLWVSLDGHDNESFKEIRGLPNAYDRSVANLERFLALKVKRGSKMKVFVTAVIFAKNAESLPRLKEKWTNYPGVDGFVDKGFVTFDGSVAAVNEQSERHHALNYDGMIWCNDPWTYVTVAWNGDVLPCCNDYNAKYVLGNVKSESLAEIWQGPRMRALREEFVSGRAKNPLCSKCEKTRYPRLGDPGLVTFGFGA